MISAIADSPPVQKRQSFGRCLSLALIFGALAGCGGGKSPDPVKVTSVFPVRGSALGGQLIQVGGLEFHTGIQVKIDGQDCTAVTVVSTSLLTCVTPAHAQGTVSIQAVTSDRGQATITDAYTYRASDTGFGNFGVIAAAPVQGAYANPFSATLESVLDGFDPVTVTRAWVVDGTPYNEGDSVAFAAGSHTMSLAIRDVTGDTDQASWTIVVGPVPNMSPAGNENIATNAFTLSPDDSISLVNTGLLPLLNPRLIGAGKPDYVDWARYLNSLTQIGGLPTDASEASRATLLEAAWRDLANSTVHVCSPGRENENINDPVLLVRGYGYECCSNASRALAYLGSFLDIPARVRTTAQHEFPEFTVAGNMFVLDPDLRYRYWGDDQLPLSAWTSASTPVSLMNVQHYFAETPTGATYETQAGGTLPFGIAAQYPEADIRAFYTTNIMADTVWGYREAFTKTQPDYALYPNEKIAFSQASSYTALQWLKSDGTPTGGAYAPAVGKVVFRRLWSANGPRAFQQDGSGNQVIPLNGVPYPVQDLVFYFSKPIDPQAFWLTAGGNKYTIGNFTTNTWTVSADQLRILSNLSDLAAVVSPDQDLVAVDIGMQFNPGIFGDPTAAVSLRYADDNGDCQRQVSVTSGGSAKNVPVGSSLCDARVPLRVETSYDMTRGQPGASLVSNYGTSYQGSWGLGANAGVKAYAEISLPRTAGLPGLLRTTDAGAFFADWQIFDGTSWTPLSTTDMATSQWVTLPATDASTSQLRVTLRQAPAVGVTYLSYLSLIEGQDTAQPTFVSASMSTSSAAVKTRAGAH